MSVCLLTKRLLAVLKKPCLKMAHGGPIIAPEPMRQTLGTAGNKSLLGYRYDLGIPGAARPHRLAPSPTRACTAAARGLARATSCSGHARGGRRERWRRGQSVRRARRPDMWDARLINHTGPVPSKAPGPGEEQLVVLTLTCGGDDGWGLGVQGTRGSCPAGCPSGCPPRAPWCMWGGRLVTKRLRCARSPCPALLQPHPDLPSKPHLGLWAARVHWCTAHP